MDDESKFRDVLVEHLGGKGFEVREAGSGEDAVERVAEFDPHIVLLDQIMAGMGGLVALRQIKTVAPRTCVIMVTALDDLDTARRALAQVRRTTLPSHSRCGTSTRCSPSTCRATRSGRARSSSL